jgi:hypothetical protein
MALAIAAGPCDAADNADPAFELRCASTRTKALPKGMAGAGSMKFTIRVDPATQTVLLDGGRHAAKIDRYEIAFAAGDAASVSISRSMRQFGAIVPIKDLPQADSRKYLYFQGNCEAV